MKNKSKIIDEVTNHGLREFHGEFLNDNELVSNRWITSIKDNGRLSGCIEKIKEKPKRFYALDDWLRVVAPNISILDYNFIYDEFVSIVDGETNDYYYSEEYERYYVNLESVWDFLVKRGYGFTDCGCALLYE